MSKHILMIIASHDFRDEEFLVPKHKFEEKGYQVTVASSSLNPSKGILGAVVKPDCLLQNVAVEDFDAVVYVGGHGASEYWEDPVAHQLAQKAAATQKLVSAICVAPVTLANAGLLNGKKATVWVSEVAKIKQKGASVVKGQVVEDGKIITANGPGAAQEFAEKIIQSLG